MTLDVNVPPQALEAEESILGAMMISSGAINVCREILSPTGEEFYMERHQKIWQSILALDDLDKPVDVISLQARLTQDGILEDVGGRVRVHELAALVPSTANAGHYARIVRDCAARRALIRKGGEIAELGWRGEDDAERLIDQAQEEVFALSSWRQNKEIDIAAIAREAYSELEEVAKRKTDLLGLTTSIPDLDRYTRGLRGSALYIIAATTGSGKSALATSIVTPLLLKGVPIAFYSMEMGRLEVIYRLISLVTGIDHDRLTLGDLRVDEWPRVVKALGQIAASNFKLETDATITPSALRGKLRKLAARKEGLGLVVVDYLQLVSPDRRSDNRTRDVAEITRALKQMAMTYEVPILALAQLNRNVDQRLNSRPILADLKESGEIEQAADCVFFIWKNPDREEGEREILIAKNRHGQRDVSVPVSWIGRRMRFGALAGGGRFS